MKFFEEDYLNETPQELTRAAIMAESFNPLAGPALDETITRVDYSQLINYMKRCDLVRLLIQRQDVLDSMNQVLNSMRCTRSSLHVLAYLALMSLLDSGISASSLLRNNCNIDDSEATRLWGQFQTWCAHFPTDIQSSDFLQIEVPNSVLIALQVKANKTSFDHFISSVFTLSESGVVTVITIVDQEVEWVPKFVESANYWTLANGQHFNYSTAEMNQFTRDCQKIGVPISRGNPDKAVEVQVDFRPPEERVISIADVLGFTLSSAPTSLTQRAGGSSDPALSKKKSASQRCFTANGSKKTIRVDESKEIDAGIYSVFLGQTLLGGFFVGMIKVRLDSRCHIDAEGAAVVQQQKVACYRSIDLSMPTKIYIPAESLGLYFGDCDVFVKSYASVDNSEKQLNTVPLARLKVNTKSGPAELVFGNRPPLISEINSLRAESGRSESTTDSAVKTCLFKKM
jgi:hypothetical protein